MAIRLGLQTLSNGKLVPSFNVVSNNIDLPKDHIKIHIHGNIVAKIADAFKSLFMGSIRDSITKSLRDALSRDLPNSLN